MGKKERMSMKELLKKRMTKGKTKGGSDYENKSIFKSDGEVKFWNCKEGQHWIDIIPYIAGKNDPDTEEGEMTYVFQPYIHRNVGPNDVDIICLAKTYGKECAICNHLKQLSREGADEDAVTEMQVQKNPRAIYNIIDKTDEGKTDKEVQVFHASHFTIEQHLLELATKPTRGKENVESFIYFASPDEDGRTIFFKRKGMGLNTKYIAHDLEERDYSISDKMLKGAYCLDELVFIPTYEEQEKLLFGESEESEENKKNDNSDRKNNKRKSESKKSKIEDEDEDVVEEDEDEDVVEEDEDEDVVEEDEDDKGDLITKLEYLDRNELKKFKKELDLKFRITGKMEKSDVIEAIINEVKEKDLSKTHSLYSKMFVKDSVKEEDSSNENEEECPFGYVFGEDFDSKDKCEDCPDDTWRECSKAKD